MFQPQTDYLSFNSFIWVLL